MKLYGLRTGRWLSTLLAAGILWFSLSAGSAQSNAAPTLPEKVGATATEVGKQIQDTGEAALSRVELLWQRIDEKRLKNRTPDEIVAWALMGLLVGGMVFRLTKMNQGGTILVGLIGAFMGGILVNVFQLDFGLGPVLIRYEDLLFSILGGFALFFAWRWFTSRKASSHSPK